MTVLQYIETKDLGNMTARIYESEHYQVSVRDFKEHTLRIVYINKKATESVKLPDIYANTVDDEKEVKLFIQTAGYGAMPKEDIAGVIKGYEIAVATVTELETILEGLK